MTALAEPDEDAEGGPEAVALARRTQRLDVIRSAPAGIVQTFEISLLLTILQFHFGAGGWAKASVAAASGVGLLGTAAVTEIARRSGRKSMDIAAIVSTVGAVALAVSATGPLAVFVIGAVLAVASTSAALPLQTAMYERNFEHHDRGRRVSIGMAVRVAMGAAFGYGVGQWLKRSPDMWWLVLVIGAGAALAVAVTQWITPSAPLDAAGERGLLPHFELLAEDRQLRVTLISWMFMGIGNLMLLPLRIEYLTRPEYGIFADELKVTMLMLVVPSVVRLLCLPLFGSLFDTLSFFAARILVNVFFAAYIAAFFTGSSTIGLVAGAVLFGIGAAGGDLMWSLWVIKFAPTDRVADYMGLHTFSTGLRALVAPFLGYWLIGVFDLSIIALASAAMIIIASLMLWPDARAARAAAEGQ